MNLGLRTLLTAVVDYAGLFPPAKLPLEPAIRTYVRDGAGADAWMLGRFVCPADRLADLDPLAEELFQSGVPVLFAALGRGAPTIAAFHAAAAADLAAVDAFRRTHKAGVIVDAFEVRLPPDVFAADSSLDVGRLLDDLQLTLEGSGCADLMIHFELPAGVGLVEAVPAAAAALHGRRQRGFKLRCGGLKAEDFPTPAQVAAALTTCQRNRVPLKATAGLHHPLPRLDAATGARMHGFVNLLVAGALAEAHSLDAGRVADILADETPEHFHFDDGGLRWGDLRAGITDIAAARRRTVLSFGSCSFDEPRDDLRALGWL